MEAKLSHKELRVGNWIQEFNFGKMECELIDIESISQGDTLYAPILLTEDWLLKFGFESKKVNQYRLNMRLIVNRNGFFYDFGSDVYLKYVHQIQNFWFALTGEELTIKV